MLRRDTGEAIPLTAKVFDTLLYLVEHAGETLDKDVLLRAIWPGVIVEENSLTQNISTLRQVLGETPARIATSLTIPRKGYRFVAKVTRREERAASTPRSAPPVARLRLRERSAAGAVAHRRDRNDRVVAFVVDPTRRAAPVAGQTLAILPFKPLLPAERNESLELGMTESLISSLGQHSPRAISPLSSVRRYAALDQDPIAAGRELDVDTVLDGRCSAGAIVCESRCDC